MLGVLAVGTTFIGYVFFAQLHSQMSSFLPSAVTSPRFLVGAYGGYLLWLLMAATVFLAFDLGNRERRERMSDVLDSRPASNVQLLAGRLVGVIVTLAVPLVVAFALIQGIGALGQALDWPVRSTIEPVSLAVFLLADALPALVFWSAAVFLLATALRNRLAVVVVAFALLGSILWSLSYAPAWLLATVALAPDRLVSDLVSPLPNIATFVQRGAVAIAGVGLLVFAAACLPRPDAVSRARYLIVGAVLLAGGAVGVAAVIGEAHADTGKRSQWRAGQQQRPGAVADILSLTGEVRIEPGDALHVDVALRVASVDGSEGLWLRFNPGMATREVLVDGQPVTFAHRDGLLRAELDAGTHGEVTVTVRAKGIPDPDFAYLDSAIEPHQVVGSGALRDLGTAASLFDRRYVALMPAVHWLPGRLADTESPRDFLAVDLVVQVPDGWLVAGPGRRESLGDGRFRFSPRAPVPQVAFLASRFERFPTMIQGRELELLLSPRHTTPVGHFADSLGEITEVLERVFRDAAALGLPYPYEALSLVEVPASLRGYGGGWQMPSTLALPGVLLLRERGFPTAHFYATASPNASFSDDKVERLEMFFKEDRSGADPFAGLARNLFLHQTAARGDGAAALEYVCHALVARLLGDTESYSSAPSYASSPSVQSLLADAFTSAFAGGSGTASAEVFGTVRPPSVWDRALGTALVELNGSEAGQAVNILTMKGDAVARTLLDGLGREATARLLAELRKRYGGASFTAADFERLALEQGADLPALLGDWLHGSALPGFVASAVTTRRLADGADGKPRYQLRLDIFNGEGVPGLLRLRYRLADTDAPPRESDPIRVPAHAAVEVGLVTTEPIHELWVAPYLSLNRREFPVRVPEPDTATATATGAVPLATARPSSWRPAPDPGIVVDDLDTGFSATPPEAIDAAYDVDEGLPVYQRLDPVLEGHWSRQEQPTSYGRYRHTIARVTAGQGDRAATFSAVLPRAGRWRVDYHLPDLAARYTTQQDSPFRLTANLEITSGGSRGPQLGTYDMKLISDGTAQQVEFDASATEPGWTTLGRYDLAAGPVSLVVTNSTGGRTVVADAVRFAADDP
ncbi:MAG: hypothetical protein OXH15_01800 [Gammaproteobacteria bacterium]|nr:hypothetical protein [Gammaproteobacteria bacterium]